MITANPKTRNICNFVAALLLGLGHSALLPAEQPPYKAECQIVASGGKFGGLLSCMDTRLVALLPAALGLKNGDVKIIKNAGGTITNPFDSTMRSLLVAVYELGVNEVMIIGHTGCGVQGMDAKEMLHLMKERGVDEEHIQLMRHCGIDLNSWLHGFDDTESAVLETVDLVKNHPLMAKDVIVRGYIMDSETGELKPI